MEYSVVVHLHDSHASANEVAHEYKLTLLDEIGSGYDAVIVAVGHQEYLSFDASYYTSIMNHDPILVDLKGIYQKNSMKGIESWRL